MNECVLVGAGVTVFFFVVVLLCFRLVQIQIFRGFQQVREKKKKSTKLIRTGFEPAPPKRSGPKPDALDHSAT